MSLLLKSFAVLLAISFFLQQDKRITVYLIGDSTMSIKATSAYPETGWGMPFAAMFDSTVVIDNRAKNGRSTRTFISEKLWEPIYENLKPGDYVFIQFGHNDEVKEKTDRYSSPQDFKRNLTKFIMESRSKKATPVLLTPVSRRRFVNGQIQDTHAEYSKLVTEVAAEQKAAFIDLDMRSRELLQQFGEEDSKLLFLQLAVGEHPNYPEGRDDNTHFNELGARKMAQIVLQEIKHLKLDLASRVVKPTVKK